MIELLKKIITNVLTALYQPFWFAVILTVFLLFFYLYAYKPIDTGKGIRAAFRAWWQEFRTSLFFRKLFLLTFFTVMILFQTLINRNMWINPLSDIMGGWWIWHTAADGTVTLTTECFENIVLMLPFTALLLWTVAEKIFCGRKITFGRCVWISTKTAFLFSLAIEFLQLFLRLGTFQLSVLLLPAIWLIINIKILNISPDFLFDARMTFSIIFINFIVSLLGAFLGIVLYAKNILWKGSFRTLESNILRVFLIVVFFILFGTKIYYVVLATLVSGLYCYAFNYYYTKKYTPELRVRKKYFSFSAIKELAAAGIWNSITKLSQILLDGLDLLLSNLFINGLMTGNVSIAKTIPSLYTSLVAMLSDSFYPEFLENYSKNRKEELLKNIKQSINILSMISGICLSMLLVYAKDFYMLWLPDNDANLLRNLTILGTGTVLISGCVYSLFSVFSLTNKVKANSMVLLITGILSTVTTFLCLKFTNLGVYAIVGVSSIYGIVRNLTFTPIYAAKCLNFKFWTFYPVIFKNLLNVALLIVVENIMKRLIVPNTWLLLIVNGILDVIVGTLITLFIMFNAQDRKTAIKKILRK